ncbi:uncharacterized protein LOC125613947 [Marmota marmota marmota]|uniref:uncharacterized protein LOC125613947 n=1 Tax=Marmota marmota marmota TaxID=9994 RepID=UPI00209344EF|nr:uncharacterized protein LOC125613947 [Marmota marmota marmota]XP_048651821.1 uncharacterized protein LOC125613947 [Marmota marmota marmota]
MRPVSWGAFRDTPPHAQLGACATLLLRRPCGRCPFLCSLRPESSEPPTTRAPHNPFCSWTSYLGPGPVSMPPWLCFFAPPRRMAQVWTPSRGGHPQPFIRYKHPARSFHKGTHVAGCGLSRSGVAGSKSVSLVGTARWPPRRTDQLTALWQSPSASSRLCQLGATPAFLFAKWLSGQGGLGWLRCTSPTLSEAEHLFGAHPCDCPCSSPYTTHGQGGAAWCFCPRLLAESLPRGKGQRAQVISAPEAIRAASPGKTLGSGISCCPALWTLPLSSWGFSLGGMGLAGMDQLGYVCKLVTKEPRAEAGDVAQAVARSPGMVSILSTT